MKKLYLIAFTAIFVWISPAFAATTYDFEAEFISHIASDYYLEDFSTYTDGVPLNGTQTTASFGPVNGFSWYAEATNGLWSNLSALSNAASEDLITIYFTGMPVTAIGGLFAPTDEFGMYTDLKVVITLSDGTIVEKQEAISPYFVGFVSTIPITSMTIDGIDDFSDPEGDILNYPEVDHFYVGAAKTIIPEPSLLLLLASGLIGLASLRRRWNK